MTDAYLELIENFLASELETGFDDRATAACDHLTKAQLDFFRRQFYEIDTLRHETMVRPLPARIANTENTADVQQPAGGGDETARPASAMFAHPYNGLRPLDVDHLKRQLLFFSRAAVIVPRPESSRDLRQDREEFKTFLHAFLELKPLVEDKTVELVPLRGFYSNEIEGAAAIVRIACAEDPEITAWIRREHRMVDDFALDARPGDPFFDAGIRICSALAYGHTLAATHPFVGFLYKLLLDDKARVDRGRIAAIRNLDKIHLPGLSGLAWEDVRSVRQHEDSLRQWRADLQLAISQIDPDLPPEKFLERFDVQVQAHLSRAALELDRNIKRSSAMSRFRKGRSDLLIAAVAGAAKYAVCGPLAVWGEVRRVLQDAGAKEAVRFIWESKEASATRALRAHYAVFENHD